MKPQIYYWRGSTEIRADLIQAFKQEGFSVQEIRDLDELNQSLREGMVQMLVVDCSAGVKDLSTRIVELSAATKLFEIPTVFFGVQATNRTSGLRKQFKFFLALDLPFRLELVFPAIRQLIAGEFHKGKARESGEQAEVTSAPIEQATVTAKDAEADRQESLSILQFVEIFPREAFHAGRAFSSAKSVQDFEEESVLPSLVSGVAMKAALSEISQADPWLGVHVRRVAALSAGLIKGIDTGAVHESNIKAVSLLLNWGLVEEFQHLQHIDVFCCPSPDLLGNLAQAYAASCALIKKKIDDELAIRTVEAIVRLLSHQESGPDKEVLDDARCVLASEFTDRSCWNQGYWNPMGAYRALRRIRTGEPINLGEKVPQLIGRALGEAVMQADIQRSVLFPVLVKMASSETTILASESELLSEALQQKHLYVPVSQLMPGMKLLSPIVTKDGQMVMSADITLDEDLIWRLWQLAAIRPVEPKVTVLAD